MMHAPMEVEETGKSKTGPSSSSSPASSKRWNPTKEQISLLEGMYKQGVRTPSSEQIQQITGKLREYGSIEGKNVFYWFQNHKARQRQKQKQKQKQENAAYFSRLLNHHHHPPPPPIPPPLAPPSSCTNNNAVCTPYYVPASHVGCVGFLPPHFPAILLPATAVVGESSYFPITAAHFSELEGEIGRRRNSTDHRRERCDGPAVDVNHGRGRDCSQETLQLFPLHPTWFSEERRRSESGRTPTSESTEEESVVMEVDGDDLVAASRDLFGSRGSNAEPPRGMKTPTLSRFVLDRS